MSQWTSITKKGIITYTNEDNPSQTITILNEKGESLIECNTGNVEFSKTISGNIMSIDNPERFCQAVIDAHNNGENASFVVSYGILK